MNLTAPAAPPPPASAHTVSAPTLPDPPISQFAGTLSTSRVIAVDALRGFIMFWICGGDYLVSTLAKAMPGSVFHAIAGHMTHKLWSGVVFYDLIFPSFVFIVGVSLVFSLSRIRQEKGAVATVRRVVYRSLILYLLGVFLYGGLSKGIENIRWLGVLQRIGICYLFAGLGFALLRPRTLVALCTVILVGYWAALTFIPIRNINLEQKQFAKTYDQPGPFNATWFRDHQDLLAEKFNATHDYVSGKFEDGLNLTQHIDYQYLPGKRYDGAYDPEGLLSTLPAIATCLLGVFAGLLLKGTQLSSQRKALILFAAGLAGVLLGELWGVQFPVIKKIWTSSYVLVAGGFSCLFLAAFYQVIEIWGYRRWALPFLWFGMNSIAIYVIFHVVEFRTLAERIVGGPVKDNLGIWANPLLGAVSMLAVLLIVRGFYQRKVFFKL